MESELNLDNIITNIILSNGINILSGFYGVQHTNISDWLTVLDANEELLGHIPGDFLMELYSDSGHSERQVSISHPSMAPVLVLSHVRIHPYISISKV